MVIERNTEPKVKKYKDSNRVIYEARLTRRDE